MTIRPPDQPMAKRFLDVARRLNLRPTVGLGEPAMQSVVVGLFIQLITLGSGVVLARSLGAAGRGNLTIAMLWPTLIGAAGGLGIAEAVTFYSAREKNRSHALAAALAMGVPQSLLLIAGGYLLLPFLLSGKSAGLRGDALVYLWVIPLLPLTLYPLAVIQGRLAMRAVNISRLSVNCAYTLILIGLALTHSVSIHTALLASLASIAISGIVINGLVIARGNWSWQFDRRIPMQLLSFGTPLHLGNLAALASSRLDIVALSVLSSSVQLGYYVVGIAIGTLALLVPTSISLVLFPIFSRQPSEALPHVLSRFLLVGLLVSLVVTPILLLSAAILTSLVFGKAFQAATPTATIMVIAYAIRGWNVMLTAVVRGGKRPFRASFGELIGLVLLLALLPVLVPALGSAGAALAVTFGGTAMLAWMVRQALLVARISPRDVIRLWGADLRTVVGSI